MTAHGRNLPDDRHGRCRFVGSYRASCCSAHQGAFVHPLLPLATGSYLGTTLMVPMPGRASGAPGVVPNQLWVLKHGGTDHFDSSYSRAITLEVHIAKMPQLLISHRETHELQKKCNSYQIAQER